MMEPFVIYIILCIPLYCKDVSPKGRYHFVDQKSCTSFVGKVFERYRKDIKKEGMIFTDGRAFCLSLLEKEEPEEI